MGSLRFHRRRTKKRSGQPGAVARLSMVRLEDRLAPAAFTVNSLLDTASPPSGVTTLRSAIAAANADNNTDPAHPDVIEFSAAGTIALGSALPAITGSLMIQGPGRGNLTVLGPSVSGGVVAVATTGTATISGLTVDGNSANTCVSVDGSGSVALNGDVITHGNANFGGGIFTFRGTVAVADSTITANGGNFGGGIYTGGNLTVTRSTISNNVCGGDGAGIEAFAGLSPTTLTITGSTFTGNVSSGHGGAIGLRDSFNGAVTINATVADSTFVGNSAFYGGAIGLFNQFNTNVLRLTIDASTITRNVDVNYGSGPFGGGLYVHSGCPVRLFDTILADNGEGSLDVHNQIVSNSGNDDVSGVLDPTGAANIIGARRTRPGWSAASTATKSARRPRRSTPCSGHSRTTAAPRRPSSRSWAARPWTTAVPTQFSQVWASRPTSGGPASRLWVSSRCRRIPMAGTSGRSRPSRRR